MYQGPHSTCWAFSLLRVRAQAAERIRQPFLALMLANSAREHEPMWEQVRNRLIYMSLFVCLQVAEAKKLGTVLFVPTRVAAFTGLLAFTVQLLRSGARQLEDLGLVRAEKLGNAQKRM